MNDPLVAPEDVKPRAVRPYGRPAHQIIKGVAIVALAATTAQDAAPTPVEEEETVISVVEERSDNLIGKADSASEGVVGPAQLERRPILRPGELLETVPGVIITQHSGSGKANQYYLRGFNLDHGTDLAVSLDGMPLNMPTHGHGQGYIDLNLLIPEMVSGIRYRKGAYDADQGDFSSAGSVDIGYARRLGKETGVPATQSIDIGNFGRRRILATGSPRAGKGYLTYGVEAQQYDGPWDLPEDYDKINAVLRYAQEDDAKGLTVTGMLYDGKWNSTDQIPARAVDTIGRFGNVDPTDGGKSHRYSLSGQTWKKSEKNETRFSAYAVDYKLNLWSNFTYFLDDPVRGDQFEQADRRRIYGFSASHQMNGAWRGRPMSNTFGLQGRYDDISPVGLYNTDDRDRFNTVREDRVKESSIAPYFENRIRWTDRLRSTAGIRFDSYRFDVNSSIAANSGKVSDSILSPKLSLAYRLRPEMETYISAGRGFHSNDARGTTITVDPKTGLPADKVTPLVRAEFAEVGLRRSTGNLTSTLSLWGLDFDSELLFVGDAGTTEPSHPSRRVGVELTNYWNLGRNWIVDADFAYSRARFRDSDPTGDRIPGAVEGVAALGVSYDPPTGVNGALRLRYFGPRPLIEDNSVRSASTTLVNGRVGYKWKKGVRFSFEVFNLLNAKVSDVDYFYTSRLPGEPAGGVDDIHFHPAESRSFRIGLAREF